MSTDSARMTDAFHIAMQRAEALKDGVGLVGYGVAELRGPNGELKQLEPFANLITDIGDSYYATMGIALVQPSNTSAPTLVSRMKIGSGGATSAAKSGAGAVLVTWLATQAFDSTYPQTANLGAGLGVNAVYKCTYAAGTGTGTVSEATVSSSTAGSVGAASDTISRVTFTGIVKGAGDSLAVTWNHKMLGA